MVLWFLLDLDQTCLWYFSVMIDHNILPTLQSLLKSKLIEERKKKAKE